MLVYLLPASQFEVTNNKISSEIFLEQTNNELAVARNSLGTVVGQLITNGIKLNFTTADASLNALELCIAVTKIWNSDNYPSVGLAKIVDGHIVVNTPGVLRNNSVCASVDEIGSYFGVAFVNDWETRERYNRSNQIQAVISAVIYFILFVGACVQTIRGIMRYRNKSAKKKKKNAARSIIFAVLIVAFSVLRVVYMATPPSVYEENTFGYLVIFEVAGIIFFWMYTTILYLWLFVILQVKSFGKLTYDTFFRVYYILNSVIALVFIAFIIAYYAIGAPPQLPCQVFDEQNSSNGARYAVNVAYLIFIACVSVVVALMYVLVGTFFLRELRNSQHRSRAITMTVAVTCTFVPMFIVKSALLLWAAVAGGVVPTLAFSLLELIPGFVLLFFIRPWGSNRAAFNSRSGTSTNKTKSTNTATSKSRQSTDKGSSVNSTVETSQPGPSTGTSTSTSSIDESKPSEKSVAKDKKEASGGSESSPSGTPPSESSPSASVSESGSGSASGSGSTGSVSMSSKS